VAAAAHQHADDLAARVGRPLELAGIAVRRPARDRGDLPVDPALFTDDAQALVDRGDIDVVVEVIGGIEPARTLILARLEAGPRSSPPTRRCSPRTARRCSRRPTSTAATSTTRPRSPARSRCCGRCASRWPATGSAGCWAS
jgi:hypothetical protein